MLTKYDQCQKIYEFFNPERYDIDLDIGEDNSSVTLISEDTDKCSALRTILPETIECSDGEIEVIVKGGEDIEVENGQQLFDLTCEALRGIRSAKSISYAEKEDEIVVYMRVLLHKDRYPTWFEEYDLDNHDKDDESLIEDNIFYNKHNIYLVFID